MDAEPETEQALLQQQLLLAAQLQAEDARVQAEEEPFADFEWRYNQASGALLSSMRTGGIAPEEQEFFNQLQEQYESAKARQEALEKSEARTDLGGDKPRAASPPIFVQQDEPYHDEEYGDVNASTGAKRKRAETSKNSPKSPKHDGMTETIRQSLRRLIAGAPADKKQAAIRDSARVLHAIKQFRAGDVKYLGEGTWAVEGVITPVKTHQLIHAGWMNERESNAKGPKGGILADKMGLGKTLCSLTSMVQGKASVGPKSSKTNLVVVPKSLKDQWIVEARRHTVEPSSDDVLGLGYIYPYSPESSSEAQMIIFKGADLVIATYSELCSAFKNVTYPDELSKASEKKREDYFNDKIRPTLSALFRFKFRAIYLDEGHQIQNVKTISSMACQKLMSKYRWILTGTPMTNDPTDLYSVLTFTRHPEVSQLTFRAFKVHYRGVDESDSDEEGWKKKRGKGGRKAKRGKKAKNTKDDEDEKIDVEWVANLLHDSMRSWSYEDELFGHPLTNIPKPKISEHAQALSVPESVIYEVVQERLEQSANHASRDPELDATRTYKFVEGLLMKLRQMTGHPLLIDPKTFKYLTDDDMAIIYKRIHSAPVLDPYAHDFIVSLGKLQRSTTCVVCEQRAQDIQWAECNHAYCYNCLDTSMHLAAEKGLRSALCKLCELPIGQITDGAEEAKDEKPRWRNDDGKVIPSTKSSAVVSFLKSWRDPTTGDPQAKIVVFTSFKECHKLLGATFEEEQWKYTALTSNMSSAERNDSVGLFKQDPETFIMLATNGVGGTGLNLMNAKYLINYDHYFNESTELQAQGRIVRIGQQEETTIVSLTATGTVDEHVKNIKSGKTDNINNVMNATDKLTIKDLLKMFEKAKKNNDIVEPDLEDGL